MRVSLAVGVCLFAACGAPPPAAPLPPVTPAWTVGPALSPLPDGRPALVVWVIVDDLPSRLIEAFSPSFNGGLVRLTSPQARRWSVIGDDASDAWMADQARAAGGTAAVVAVDAPDAARFGVPERTAWTDLDALAFAGTASDTLDVNVPLRAFAARPWFGMKPGLYGSRVPDDQPVERGPGGIGRVFPHPAPDSTTFEGVRIGTRDALLASPALGDALTGAAMITVRTAALGRADHTDLLVISYGQVGHIVDAFTADSWEAYDALLRLDVTLGVLFDHLDRAVGEARWAVVLTASADANGPTPWLAWGAGVTAGAVDVPAADVPRTIGAALHLPSP